MNVFIPLLPARPGVGDFFRGFALPFRSIGLVFQSRPLFLLTAASSVVTLLSLVGLAFFLGSSTGDLLGWFWARPESWYGSALWRLVFALTFLLLFAIGANTVPLLLLAPLQDPISEATGALCGEFSPPPFSWGRLVKGAALSLVHTAKRVALLFAGHLVLAPLNLIPGAGSLAWTVLATAWTIWWVAFEYLSAPMARHLYPFAEVRRALSARKALAMGFGFSVYLLLWVPIVNFLLVPLAIIGGTLLFRGLRTAGHIAKA